MTARVLKALAPASSGLLAGAAIFSGLVAVFGAMGPNSDLALLSAMTFLAGVALLARTARLPALLAAFAQPWLQGSVAVFHSNYLGADVSTYSDYGGDMQSAVALSLAGVVAIALGMRIGAGAPGPEIGPDALAVARASPVSRWFGAYAAVAAATFLLGPAASLAPGLYQFLLAAYNTKWAFFFALAYASAARNQATNPYFLAAFAFELAMGLGGFFSDFKSPFLYTIFAFAAAARRIEARSLMLLGVASVGLLTLGAAWSEVKGSYRAYLSGGSGQQIVTVDYETRIATLASMFSALDGDGMAEGFDRMVRRLSYVEFFAVELEYVPNVAPYTNGEITMDAISRPFMPRLLFPEKSAISDTARTERLTGIGLNSGGGTSISLGYIGEFYSDFGVFGLLVALVAMGGVYGWAYRWLTKSARFAGPLGMGLACEALFMVASMENSFTKVFGGFVAGLLACWVLGRFAIRKYWPWMLIA